MVPLKPHHFIRNSSISSLMKIKKMNRIARGSVIGHKNPNRQINQSFLKILNGKSINPTNVANGTTVM